MYLIDNSSVKSASGYNNLYEGNDTYTQIRYGVVKLLESETGAKDTGLGRIKVYIKGPISTGGDGDTPDTSIDSTKVNELPWCFPFLPKHLSTQPKVGEVVWVFTINKNSQHADRLYIGPIISQLPLLDKDPFQYSALAGFTFGPQEPKISPTQISQLKGVFPDSQDISIQGRYNTDITQKTNEVVIRAGKFELTTPDINNPYSFSFNAKTQAYIQIKNDVVVSNKTDQQEAKKGSVTNIVANKINLITHEDGSPRFNVTNQDNLISDEELANILDQAHPLAYGDLILEYLRLMKDALFSHVHNGNGNAATDLTASGDKQALAVFKAKADDLEKTMLSKNVRIN